MKRRKNDLFKQKEKVIHTDNNGNHLSSDIPVKSIFTRLLGGNNEVRGKENEDPGPYQNTPSSSSKKRISSGILLNQVNNLFHNHT